MLAMRWESVAVTAGCIRTEHAGDGAGIARGWPGLTARRRSRRRRPRFADAEALRQAYQPARAQSPSNSAVDR